MARAFTVGLTHDFLSAEGRLTYRDIGLERLAQAPGVEYRFLDPHPAELRTRDLRDLDALILMAGHCTRESLRDVERLLAVVRFGVGYDRVDVGACTDAGVLLCITAGAVDRSIAEATLAWMLALSHNVLAKDQLVRQGRWHDRSGLMGCELRERTLGVVGLGGIGRSLVGILGSLGMKRPLAFDPHVPPEHAAQAGVTPVPLARLLRESDFVSINCPFNDQTRGLIGSAELALMRSDAFLINTARGGIVDEEALFEALRERRIAGAAVDVFASEPIDGIHPLASLDNVILAPHCIGWTDELFRDMGHMACQAVVNLARGEIPHGAVNRDVLVRPAFRAKWESVTEA